MNLSKRLLLLNHMNTFIMDQYGVGETTEDILGMLKYKSDKYKESEKELNSNSTRKMYLSNYSLLLVKRIIDFQFFRNKNELIEFFDIQIFKLIDFRDKIIFKKIFKD